MIIDINPQIISLLEDKLIKPKNGLKDIYDRIKKYKEYKDLKNLIEKSDLNDCIRKKLDGKVRTMAIDFPIEIRDSDSSIRRTIMVCALDSLPPDSDMIHDNIITWAPFSLIKDWDNKEIKGSFQSNKDFFSTIFNEYNFYVTDIFKLFYRIEKSRSTYEYGKEGKIKKDIFKDILAEEINIIKPLAIVTLGNKARDMVYQFFELDSSPKKWNECDGIQPIQYWVDKETYEKIRIISIPHISGSANGAKKHLLNNGNYITITDKDSNKRIAKIILSIIKQSEVENL